MTAYKQAYGEHYTHEVVPFAEVVLVRVRKPTHRALQGGKRWHKGDAVFIKGVWVGRSETADEHIVLTPGGRVFSLTIRRLEPSRRHDAAFLGTVKGPPRDAQDGIVRGRPRKETAPRPPVLIGENTDKHNSDLPDKTEDKHSETPKETDDTNDANNVPMSETPTNDGRYASHIKSKSSVDAAAGVRQRLTFDVEASGMTADPKRSKETVKQGEVRESNALPGESLEKKKVRFLPEPGGGGACAITVEELVEDNWTDERGQGEMFDGLHCKAEPDLDVINTEAALDRLLENGVVRDIPRDEGVGMKHLTTKWEETQQRVGVESSLRGTRIQRQEFWEDLFAPAASYCTGRIVDILSLKRRVQTFTLSCTDAFHQAPELEDVVVEPPEEYLNRLRTSGMCTNIWWKLEEQLPGRRQAGPRWVDHFTSVLVEKLGFTRCVSAPQVFWNPNRRVGMEVQMVDVHGFGPDPQVEKFKEDLAGHIWFRGGGVRRKSSRLENC